MFFKPADRHYATKVITTNKWCKVTGHDKQRRSKKLEQSQSDHHAEMWPNGVLNEPAITVCAILMMPVWTLDLVLDVMFRLLRTPSMFLPIRNAETD